LRQIFTGYIVGAVGYALFAPLESLPLALLMIVFAHSGGSALWVGSTTGWQRKIDDSFRGRSFSVEFLMLTISFTIGALATGALYDWNGSIQETVWAACAAVVVGSLIWRALALRLSIESESPAPKAEDPEIKA